MDYGNYLIFAGVRPMLDDRVELYGKAPTQFDYRFLDEEQIDWTFGEPNTRLDMVLDADPKWVRIYRDQFASVHARKSVWDAVRASGGKRCRVAAASNNLQT